MIKVVSVDDNSEFLNEMEEFFDIILSDIATLQTFRKFKDFNKIAQNEEFDIVLMDINLEEDDGYNDGIDLISSYVNRKEFKGKLIFITGERSNSVKKRINDAISCKYSFIHKNSDFIENFENAILTLRDKL